MRRELLWLPHTAAALACCALLQRALIFSPQHPPQAMDDLMRQLLFFNT